MHTALIVVNSLSCTTMYQRAVSDRISVRSQIADHLRTCPRNVNFDPIKRQTNNNANSEEMKLAQPNVVGILVGVLLLAILVSGTALLGWPDWQRQIVKRCLFNARRINRCAKSSVRAVGGWIEITLKEIRRKGCRSRRLGRDGGNHGGLHRRRRGIGGLRVG